MEIKKRPNAILENYSFMFLILGFTLSLFMVYEMMIFKSYPTPVEELTEQEISVEDTETLVEIKPLEIEQPKPTQAVIPEKIMKVEDDTEIKETIIESTETDENEAIVITEAKNIKDAVEEDEIEEDVPFVIIEEVPIFPGCSGNNQELRACISEQIAKFVSKRFDVNIASDLGLSPGSIQRIFVVFKINSNGEVTNIQARAPHIKLQNEAVRVVSMLPNMVPGKQRGKPVSVSYGLPIVFKVE